VKNLINSRIYNNIGAGSDGVQITTINITGESVIFFGNTIYANGRDGVRIITGFATATIVNNLLVSNGGYGIRSVTKAGWGVPVFNCNAFYNNTSGPSYIAPLGPGSVNLTGDPFVNAAAGNFALNNTAGAGAAIRSQGYIGTSPAGTTVGFLSIGAAQVAAIVAAAFARLLTLMGVGS
jgi:hypothetical protein